VFRHEDVVADELVLSPISSVSIFQPSQSSRPDHLQWTRSVLAHPVGIELHHLAELLLDLSLFLKMYLPSLKNSLAAGVQRDRNLIARLVASLLDGLENASSIASALP